MTTTAIDLEAIPRAYLDMLLDLALLEERAERDAAEDGGLPAPVDMAFWLPGCPLAHDRANALKCSAFITIDADVDGATVKLAPKGRAAVDAWRAEARRRIREEAETLDAIEAAEAAQ